MQRKGADILISCLEQEGVEVIFGYPGGAVLGIYDALMNSQIRHILVRHEQAAAHAADGYARATGKVGVCLATSGPGGTNLVTGIATAYVDSIPLIAITGQAPLDLLGRDSFQEADTTGITMPVTKHNYLVKRVEDLARVVKEAFHIASTGRPGPVLIDIPKDVCTQETDFEYPVSLALPGYKPSYKGHPTQIVRAAEAINSASRPVIYAGGGVISSMAWENLYELADKAQIPVATTLMAKGAFPGDHPLSLGMLGIHGLYSANKAVTACDLLIALGARFDERATGPLKEFAPDAKIIHVDIDPAEIGKNVQVDIPIVGDVSVVLKELIPKVAERSYGSKWHSMIEGYKRDTVVISHMAPDSDQDPSLSDEPDMRDMGQIASRPEDILGTGAFNLPEESVSREKQGKSALDPIRVVDAIFKWAGPQAFVTTDVGQHQMWAAQRYSYFAPRHFISSGGLGTMGYGFPAALGAKAGRPESTVIAISGDGSFQMNIQELATANAYGLGVKVFILNNGSLGMVKQLQHFFCEARYTQSCLLPNPDFAKIAEAYGARGFLIRGEEGLEPAIREAIEYPGMSIVDIRIDPEAMVYPVIPPGKGLDEGIFS
jgi:acetolactate synthase-1/2/3 large subunit